jgi:biopolymer transport protein ExbB
MFQEFDWLKLTAESPAMIILIVFSVITLGVALERMLYFHRRRGNADEAAREVLQRVGKGEIKEALWACEKSNQPASKIYEVVVGTPDSEQREIDERLFVALSREKLLLERNLNVLGTMAGTAPLVGLLGTVWGIMRAFHDMARVGSAAPTVVAAGIAEALVTTAIGLVVAVPALILYNHFVRRSSVMLTVAENHARTIRGAMAARNAGSGQAQHNAKQEAGARAVRDPQPVGV